MWLPGTITDLYLPVLQSRTGTLKVSGYLRGPSLSVHGLVHLPGWGDFQMSRLDAPTDPYPLQASSARSRANTMVLELSSSSINTVTLFTLDSEHNSKLNRL